MCAISFSIITDNGNRIWSTCPFIYFCSRFSNIFETVVKALFGLYLLFYVPVLYLQIWSFIGKFFLNSRPSFRNNERVELHILKPLKPTKFPAYKHLKFVFFFCTYWFYCTEMKNRTSIYSLFCLFYTWMSLYFLIAFSNGSLDSRQLDFSKYLVHLLEKVTKYLKSCWSSDVTFHYLQVWFWICLFLCSAR